MARPERAGVGDSALFANRMGVEEGAAETDCWLTGALRKDAPMPTAASENPRTRLLQRKGGLEAPESRMSLKWWGVRTANNRWRRRVPARSDVRGSSAAGALRKPRESTRGPDL